MTKFIRQIYLVILAVIVLSPSVQAAMPTACFNDKTTVTVEVAATQPEIERGLMYRTGLAADSGMVFLFHPERSGIKFWMYHTLIPLDMCFIYKGRIVKIFENVPPCHSEDPGHCVTYPQEGLGLTVTEVVELAGGYAKSHNIKEGDKVTFQLPQQ